MLIRQFLTWAERASAGARADAACALARAYLYADLDPVDLGEAERAVTSLLDDPSPLVRRALAEAFATAVDAPHHVIVALASDQSDIASLVLERSPVLGDAILIDAVAIGDCGAQCSVARRPSLSAAVAGALAEVGTRSAALTLCRNEGAELAASAAQRLIERFGDDGEVRFALSQRSDIGSPIRHALVVATARALSEFATRCEWMSPERARRVTGEARDRATISIAANYDSEDVSGQRRFAVYLRASGHLTPALILRALLSGNVSLFEAALCELTGKALVRVAGLVRNPTGPWFRCPFQERRAPAIAAADLSGRSRGRARRERRFRRHRSGSATPTGGRTRHQGLRRHAGQRSCPGDGFAAPLRGRGGSRRGPGAPGGDEMDPTARSTPVWGRPESRARLSLAVPAAA